LAQSIKRPVGVTIIAILTIIGGIILCLGGLFLLMLGVVFEAVSIGSIGVVIGAIVLGVGIGYLVVSYGLLKGKGWAWIVTVILTIIAIIIQSISVISTSMFDASFTSDMNSLVSGIVVYIISMAINGVILYYLYRPNVRTHFGKFQSSTTIQR
jgi:hypothetical protein